MKQHQRPTWTTILAAITACLLATAGAAFADGPVFSSGSVDFPTKALEAGTLTVSGPGTYFSQGFKAGETPSFSLFTKAGQILEDGVYKWEWRPHATPATRKRSSHSVELEGSSGSFSIKGGAIVDPDLVEGGIAKDQVILDDLIVDGSICAGLDCVNGESFGFDTLRLKENNLRIKAQDTSNSASFPTVDWQITFNESSNGGLSKFSIDDIDAGRTPFTIEASADANSLYVDTGGRIGFGTNSPVVELHVKDGDTPTLRLEQDGSSGFTPQTWDVAGNETNFFIRDATTGSRLPFRIRPAAPSNSIFVDTDGDVGLGTSSPEAQLHVSDSGVVLLDVSSTATSGDAAQIRLRSGAENRRLVSRNAAGDTQSQIAFDDAGVFRFLGENNNSDVCLQFADSDSSGNFTRCTFLAGAITCAAGACP